MTPLAEILREEIRRDGPITFRKFMEASLYHPQFGYYRRPRDPFGAQGDFYTAEQLQPVFGNLIARRIRMWLDGMRAAESCAVVELGAGRGEMAAAFREFPYIPVDLDTGRLPDRIRGVVFSNEFFDALPVHAAILRGASARELRVGLANDGFTWVEAGDAPDEVECYRKKYLGALSDGQIFEVNVEALMWMDRIAASLEEGYVVSIDYGYTAAELPRFPRGTLMSYRRHQALEDVLTDPGEQDITAHVCFTALQEHGTRVGLLTEALEPLARTLMEAGEPDQFAGALAADSPREEIQRRLQLKQLLFGMGETFRTLIQRKAAQK
ncbi:MAG TPA: SAM-dependent methyltransferase [Bryobacteraceae bacterium]|nr:SAM-dependent methyltransferase [Bryobacteraceae bacterium]